MNNLFEIGIKAYGSEESAYDESWNTIEYFREFPVITANTDERIEIMQLIINGHTVQNAAKSFVAAKALGKSITEAAADIGNDNGSLKDEDNQDELAEIAREYNINPQFLIDYSTETESSAEQIKEKISKMQDSFCMYFDGREPQEAAYAPPRPDYATGPATLEVGNSEEVNLRTGAIVYEDDILHIPGRNGLDLDLVMRYNSGRADSMGRFAMNSYTDGSGNTDSFQNMLIGFGLSYKFTCLTEY